MKVLLCEGTRDMEFLTSFLIKCYDFERKKIKKNYLNKKLGLNYKNFNVVKKINEIFIFYPRGGGSEEVKNVVKNTSQMIDWYNKGVKKVGMALDLDEKNVQELINSIEQILKAKYDDVKKYDKFSFICKHGEYNFNITVIPLGDLNIKNKLGFDVSRHKIEDLILDLSFEDEYFNHVLSQAINFYKEKKRKNPTQKSLVKILESICDKPDFGTFELISKILNENAKGILPNYFVEGIEKFLRQIWHLADARLDREELEEIFGKEFIEKGFLKKKE